LLSLGIAEPVGIDHWSKAAIAALTILPLPPGTDDTRKSLLNELNYFFAAQRQIDLRLRSIPKEQDEARRIATMRSVPEVGEVVATSFAAEIFRLERFNVSQRRLRSLLIEAAWIWKQKDEWARDFYNQIYSKSGVAQKAIAALARKLAALL